MNRDNYNRSMYDLDWNDTIRKFARIQVESTINSIYKLAVNKWSWIW